MLKRKITSIICLLLVASCQNKDKTDRNNDFVLALSVVGIEEGAHVYLRKLEGNTLMVNMDTAVVKNGQAQFTGVIVEPEMFGVYFPELQKALFPILESGNIQVRVEVVDFEKALISGTTLNDLFSQFKMTSNTISIKITELYHKIQIARATNNSKDLLKFGQQIDEINQRRINYAKSFIRDHSESFVSKVVLQSLVADKISKDTVARLFNELTPPLRTGQFSEDILHYIQN